jgi:hypothetical protein
MDQVRATPLYRKLAERNRLPRFGQFDPSIQNAIIHELLLASDGKNVLAIARGDFAAKPAGDLTPSNIRASRSTAAKQAFGRAGGHRSIDKSGGRGAPRDLMARAEALPADAQIWAVVAGWRGYAGPASRDGEFGNLDRVLRLVEGASLTVDLRTGVHAAFTGDSRTEADAKTLADSLRGLAALGPHGRAAQAARPAARLGRNPGEARRPGGAGERRYCGRPGGEIGEVVAVLEFPTEVPYE